MRHPLLARPGLYVITDGPRADLVAAVTAALAGGARLVQYRDKTQDAARRAEEARALAALCARHDAGFIVNDDVELAAQVAAGVHLGEDDADIAAARTRLGDSAVIGVSCYDDFDRARSLAARGADYVAFGAFYPSSTKPAARRATPELLRRAAALDVPRVAIGGITPENAGPLIEAGADFVAVISAVFGTGDITRAASRFASLFPSP
ncbi:thiamine phosphate synthase [Tahibacter amnicola]|uniref:Thiamine-phosphate synthase n=1 Tax=Tahibacter amnicola TaxID=2976241 RepID=A0ABY6BG98_9GAMM|nr:thiamine phosphate synthase [Tahibacter amnicola]UXI69051.1 thiamine phosphate synthase [Tahibacter amnicola]